jgi:GNAT superfamily N-acetyltransferase
VSSWSGWPTKVMSGASVPRENGDDIQVGGCNNWPVSLDPTIRMRSATPEDAAFIVEMARHACVIEDWPLPDADSEEVQSVLPPSGEVPIVTVDAAGFSIGAVWTFHNDPPLRVDAAGVSLPELCIGVAPGRRGRGVGGALLDELFLQCTGTVEALCSNVHVRNPAQNSTSARAFE